MPNRTLAFLIFSEGFIVLTLQILVFVVLTPYWGQTFTFWVLSLVMSMLGLSIGYILAPKLVAKSNNDSLLFLTKAIRVLLVYLAIIYGLNQTILDALLSSIENPVTGATISLILFFFIPTAILGMVPIGFVHYLKNKESKNEGELSGSVFSLSSIGGVVGVVVVAHFILPNLGANAAIFMIFLFVLGLYLLILKISDSKKYRFLAIGVVVVASILMVSQSNQKSKVLANGIETIASEDGVLGRVGVVANNKTKTKYLMVNNNIQSMVHFSGRSLNPYVYLLSIYASYFDEGSDFLVAGLGCGSLPYEYSEMGYNVDVVDIDDRLHNLVQEHFLTSKNKYEFIHSDVRRFVKRNKKKYKVIVLDISHGENIPTNVYTKEGFSECAESLDDEGLILIHYLSSQDEKGVESMASLLKTVNEAGLNYQIMNFLNRKELFDFEEYEGNPEGFIIAVAKKDIDIHKQDLVVDPSLLKMLVPVKDSLYLDYDFKGRGVVLTDDKSALEIYHSSIANKYRKLSMKELKNNYGNE